MNSSVRVFWRSLQLTVFGVGVLIVAMLLFRPPLGLYLLWDVLIPVAPLLLVLAPGVWRNVCPLGSVSLLPAHMNWSHKRPLSRVWQERLLLGAIALLLLIVPLRHVVLDRFGAVTGVVLITVAAVALALGFLFDWKSAWCSGLCPIYPVELLYGSRPVVSVANAHCTTCSDCVSPCRDSGRGLVAADTSRSLNKHFVYLFGGGFPGFVWGWYLVVPNATAPVLRQLLEAFLLPLAGFAATMLVFLVFYLAFPRRRRMLAVAFAAVAVVIYYWFKLPVMFGLQGDGSHALLNLRGVLAGWWVWPLRVVTSGLLMALLLARKPRSGWSGRVARAAP
ncbi:MAG: hypothetical protein KDB29_08525 [Planctomycetes bacterium]|nr:hypothetical protein [Planctomycetota bacterium]